MNTLSTIGPKPAFATATLPPSMMAKVSPGIASKLLPDAASKLPPAAVAKARSTAQDFEQVFLNSMFSQMFTGMDGEGPFGGGKATGVWRSFLTDEYAKNFAKAGGIGLGDQIYRELIQQQAAALK
jgi:Rod binding domain-containing protein